MEDNLGCWISTAIAALLTLFLVVVPVGVYYADRSECSYAATNAGVRTKFVKNHLFSWRCYVMVDGGWIPIDRWRGDSEGQ